MRVRIALTTVALAMTLLGVLAAPADAGLSKDPKAQKAMAFLDMVFNQKKVKEGFDKYVGDKYIQHNPIAADGKEAAVTVLGRVLEQLPTWSYEFKHAYVDGNIAIIRKEDIAGVNQHNKAGRNIIAHDHRNAVHGSAG